MLGGGTKVRNCNKGHGFLLLSHDIAVYSVFDSPWSLIECMKVDTDTCRHLTKHFSFGDPETVSHRSCLPMPIADCMGILAVFTKNFFSWEPEGLLKSHIQ